MSVYHSLSDTRKAISAGDIDLPGLVRSYLDRIEQASHLNAFVEVFDEEALESAVRIQQKISRNNAGKLAGMILGIKDNICYKDHRVSASSGSLKEHVSVFSATAVDRLLAEDAIILGRCNCDEFAMGGTNETSVHGPVLNPIDTSLVPGGSSGGSAAAVAADLCMAALGSDTGGSIRQPASFCGLIGLKPTYGRVSRWGLIAYGSSFDQIGPITHSLEDAALILEVIAGQDDYDSTASDQPVPSFSDLLSNEKPPEKICYLKEALEHPGLDTEVRAQTQALFEILKNEGISVEGVSFPLFEHLVPSYYVMAMAEASSNLSRYDGIHYGHRSKEARDARDIYLKSRTEGFGTEVKRRIMTGTFVLSAGYYDAYYGKAQKVRRLIREQTMEILKKYPFILLPTAPRPAFPLDSMGDDPVALYLEDVFTTHANLVGVPAISLPLSRTDSGLPIGMQLMANTFREKELLSFSRQLMNYSQILA